MAELIKPGYNDTADIADINSNTDEFAARIAACKPKQTAKTDPTADGTSATFIATLTQNANGEVTATKKTVRTMTGATSSVAGATGLVPQPGTGDVGKFLKGDGTWGTPANTTYGEASSSTYGLVKIGYTASGKNYPVQLSSGKMFVNVPWTDNNTTYSQATSSALGLVKIGYTASGKNYPVQLDGSGRMYVNVPWTDNNTTYNEATSSAYGLIKIGYTANGKNYPVQLSSGKAFVNVPWTDNNTTYSEATSSTYGLIKIGYTASGKNYPVQLSGGKAYVNVPWTDNNTTYSAGNGLSLSGTTFLMSGTYNGNFTATKVYNAVWNDYAECRVADTLKAGLCVCECKDGVMRVTSKRLMPGCKIVSDTFGSCMGENENAKTPIAVAGRVLAYPYTNPARWKLGDAVCSGPDGTVDVMKREEIITYPERIIGTVSEIPDYEYWQAGDAENPESIKVNGRVWIYVR